MAYGMKKTKWIPGVSSKTSNKLKTIAKKMPKGKTKITKKNNEYTLSWKF